MPLVSKRDKWDGVERRAPARVLVVNDDPAAAELLVRVLDKDGYRSSATIGERDVMTALFSQLPRVVVLDLANVTASLKVLDTLRANDDQRIATARAILCAPNSQNRVLSFQSGADAFLVRPFHAGELLDLVDEVLNRSEEARGRHRRAQLGQ